MEIKTKYEIGQHIWVVYEDRGEIALYDTYIDEIGYSKDGLVYFTKECNDYSEEAIIPYENSALLITKIKELMNEIHKREEKENERDKI